MPVQEQVLKNAFGGADLYVQSQTGTGKTAAYLIAILQRLLTEPLLGGKKALIMVPTRELAVQVEDEAKKIAKYLSIKVGSFYGGVGYAHQQKLLRENAQIMVGTPGRVLDLNSSGQMPLMDLAFLILDEADRMFDMGFYPDLRKLIKVVPPADRRQTMLFSATLNAWVKNLAWEYTKEPLEIEIAPENVTVEEIEQLLYHVPSNDKMKLLMGIFQNEKPESAIIFCNTKRYTEIVAKRLRINGIDCEFIIGDLPQVKRSQIIEDLKSGKHKYLVATDVAARGLDIEGLALVVNYDLPNEAENYVHRIGRTARAGKTGKAISLASEQDVYQLPAIEKYLERKVPSAVAEETLYAEDKSEGMRIRTDVYEDRDGGGRSGRGPSQHGEYRGGERKDERREGRGSEGRGPRHGPADRQRAEHPRGGERAPAAAGGRERSRSPNRESGPAGERQQRPPVQAAPRDNRAAAKPDLSRVSFEERLAYYRRKYGAEQEDRARQAASEGDAGGRSRQQPPRGRANAPQNAQRGPRQGQTTGKPSTQEAPKKSLVGRILGIFRKKS
ncbi:MAG: DEAD/DEAH box helicase [Treponemataceae bacterium]